MTSSSGLLLSFSTFAVGYLARPIGGVIFGRLGDKIGRKHVLVITLLLIGVATVLIGVLPGYAAIGVAAPIILVLLRLAQGIGVGGEWGGAVLLSSEFGDAQQARLLVLRRPDRPARRQPDGQRRPGRARRDPQHRGLPLLGLARGLPRLRPAGGLRPADPAQAGGNPGLQGHPGPRRGARRPPSRRSSPRNPRALVAAALSRVCPDVLYALFTVFVAVYATKRTGHDHAATSSAPS